MNHWILIGVSTYFACNILLLWIVTSGAPGGRKLDYRMKLVVLFFGLFAAAYAWLTWKGRRQRHQELGR